MAQSNFEDIKVGLARTLKKLAIKTPECGRALLPLWSEAVGPILARHSRPVSFQNGLLVVELNPEFATDIERESTTICHRLNQLMGKKTVLALQCLSKKA
jgi:hypothetical protein